MQPSGGSTPLPLPPSPFEQSSTSPSPGSSTPPGSGSYQFQPVGPVGKPASPAKKRPSKAAGPVFVIVIVVAVLAFSGAFDGLFGSSGSSNQPSVQVTNTSASHACPYLGTPTETFLFTLVNSGSVNARAAIGFYLNDAQVYSGTYQAPAGTSTPYSVTASLSSCPPSGTTYYLRLVSVTAA